MDPTAIRDRFDFELLGSLDAAGFQGQATMGADLEFRGQFNGLLAHGQMAVITASRRGLAGLAVTPKFGLVVRRVLQIIGAVAARLLLGAASKAFRLQFAVLAAKEFVLLLQGGNSLNGTRVPTAPISGLLTQWEILTAEIGDFGPQLINLSQESSDQGGQINVGEGRFEGWRKNACHDGDVVRSDRHHGKARLTSPIGDGTASAVLYGQPGGSPFPSWANGKTEVPRTFRPKG